MTDTTTLAPTDAEIDDLADRCTPNTETGSLNYRDFARAALAKWGAPATANFPARITALLHEVKRGPWEDASGEPLQDDADAALAWIAAPPAQEARVPLSDGQIEQGHDAADIAPTDTTIGTFNDGVRFAEKHHGITAAQAAPAMDAKQLGDAVVKWLGCETTKPRGDTGEPERRIDVSVERLGFAVAAVLKTVTAPAPVAEDADDAARWRLLPLFMQGYDVDWVELLYNLEVTFKRGVRAQAAQPEGGAKHG